MADYTTDNENQYSGNKVAFTFKNWLQTVPKTWPIFYKNLKDYN